MSSLNITPPSICYIIHRLISRCKVKLGFFAYTLRMVNIFCERLKELRLERKLSAVKLAAAIGVRDTTILRWESGAMSPSIDALLLICGNL